MEGVHSRLTFLFLCSPAYCWTIATRQPFADGAGLIRRKKRAFALIINQDE
jgi:hypothetical protein